ncbi:MAG: HPr family phosphocarrier protein [Candidatus Pelethousia sp.]|nr:HPr family phosphocarrier protein [Candidatus Pelethousia sp.]
MKQIEVTVPFKEGLHARPAVKLIKLVGGFKAAVTIFKGEKEINAGSITSVLAGGIMCGDRILLKIDGPDEEMAAVALETYFQ